MLFCLPCCIFSCVYTLEGLRCTFVSLFFIFFFFFSSRRRHTRCLSDWSSDVCSSDLYWEQGQTRNAAEAWELTGRTSRRDYGPYVENVYAGDRPFHSFYPGWEQIGRASCRERV